MEVLRRYVPFAGRLLIALPFLYFGTWKLLNWEMMRGWLEFLSWPAPSLFLGAAIFTEITGSLLLIAGLRIRWTALALALYLVPVHFLLHNFWAIEGSDRQSQTENFLKGLMIIGGLLYIFAFGAGDVAVDGEGSERGAGAGQAAG